jgi:hypothetical protein
MRCYAFLIAGALSLISIYFTSHRFTCCEEQTKHSALPPVSVQSVSVYQWRQSGALYCSICITRFIFIRCREHCLGAGLNTQNEL